jgi:hypothetical protein
MKELNDKIRDGIKNSYYLRSLAKDTKLTQEEKDRAYENAKEIDKKILFYKNFNNALRNIEKNDIAKKSK